MKSIAPSRYITVSLLSASLLTAPHSLGSSRCEKAFYNPALLAMKLGVRQTGDAQKPMGIQVVESRYKNLENTINAFATWALGKSIKLDVINDVARKFLADKSADPYFVRLARAFDLQYRTNEEVLKKNIPAEGPAILVLNHPRNGSDGIAVAAAVSKIRPDTKVAMTLFLENVPGMSDNAIFLNPYGGPKAHAYNNARMLEMKEHLRSGGLIVIFASGEVSIKDPGSSQKPVDPEWKSGAARLLKEVPEAQVVPTYIGGEATREFYEARKKGLGLKTTIFHIRELANNTGRDFPLSFSSPLTGKALLEEFGTNLKGMMAYLRARTYLMSEQSILQKNTGTQKRVMEDIASSKDPVLVHEDLARTADLVYSDTKKSLHVYALEGSRMTDLVWHELGIAREKSFRVVNEGSGKSMDIDAYDRDYTHIIAVDTSNNKIIGAYRAGRMDQILAKKGVDGVYSHNFFDNTALLRRNGAQMLELGRSFVDFEAGSKAIIALDRLWKGIASYISKHPDYRYLMGPVSISNAYSTTSKLLIMKYLEKNLDPELAPLTLSRVPVDFTSQFKSEIDLVAAKMAELKDLNKVVVSLDGEPIPPLLTSYDKLGAKYLGFNVDKDFNTVDGLVLVDLLSKSAADEAGKHFGENWSGYLKHHGVVND